VRARLERNRNHFIRCGHLEIQGLGDLAFEARHVGVANVAAILP
jgi:hypothetical protein